MTVVLDVSRMAFDENGVKDFLWPLRRDEVIAMRDSTVKELVSVILNTSDDEAELVSILFTALLNEIMTLYQAHSTRLRFSKAETSVVPPAGSGVFLALMHGGALPTSDILEMVKSGLPYRRPIVIKVLGRIRRDLMLNGPSAAIVRSLDARNDIVATQGLPLVKRHARSVGDFVRLRGERDWLDPVNDQEAKDAEDRFSSASVVEGVLGAMAQGFAAGNELLPDELAQHLREWVVRGMSLADRSMARLTRHPEQVPKRLWTGTGSRVWARIVRHAVRRTGGHVTGHDHGIGLGHLVTTQATVGEFESCDVFVANTKAQAQGLRGSLRKDLLLQPNPPEIVSLTSGARSKLRLTKAKTNQPTQPKRVMYSSSIYVGETMSYMVLIPDIVALDWETRLFSHLRSWSYETIHKPHPGSVRFPPNGFVEAFGGKTLMDRFEQVMDLADVFIIVNPQTTTLASMLGSGKGVVYVDLGSVEFTAQTYRMFGQRCAIVNGWYDDENRIQVDWDQLHTAIEESVHLKDDSFFESYVDLEI